MEIQFRILLAEIIKMLFKTIFLMGLSITTSFAQEALLSTPINKLTEDNFVEIAAETTYLPKKINQDKPSMASALIAKDGKQLGFESMYFLPQYLDQTIPLDQIDEILLSVTNSKKKTPERGLYCFMTLLSSDYADNSKINPKKLKIGRCFNQKVEKPKKGGWSFSLISIEEDVKLYGCFMSDTSKTPSPQYQMGCISYSTDKAPTVKNFLEALNFSTDNVKFSGAVKVPEKIEAVVTADTECCNVKEPESLKTVSQNIDKISKTVEKITAKSAEKPVEKAPEQTAEEKYVPMASTALNTFFYRLGERIGKSTYENVLSKEQIESLKNHSKNDLDPLVTDQSVLKKMFADKNYSKLESYMNSKDATILVLESIATKSKVVTAQTTGDTTKVTIKYNKDAPAAFELTCRKVTTKSGAFLFVVEKITDSCLVSNVILE